MEGKELMDLVGIVKAGFVIYAIALILNDSYLFKPVRGWWRQAAYRIIPSNHRHKFLLIWNETDDPVLEDEPAEGEPGFDEFRQQTHGYDFISCSMCCGVWIALILKFLWREPFWDMVSAYGISYFIATQER